jgi:hypothetical protein
LGALIHGKPAHYIRLKLIAHGTNARGGSWIYRVSISFGKLLKTIELATGALDISQQIALARAFRQRP